MAKRMLIDAAHPEEIRVAVLKGNRLEDFDFETATKKQLKGNIYLAKVTRVEPSLQAAFVEYGGNRHGFLAFNEIHPDYYRIPVADREALIAQDRALAERSAENGNGTEGGDGEEFETIGGEDIEEVAPRRFRSPRSYKIQEVIKRRQILLVQVVKEERGNKGAALTTYLSLAGRYCVLMPNTPRGGGVSRKITNLKDRRRLKSILEEFEVPEGMSVIVRTAGMERNKTEIKRDLEYLMRLWDEIRTVTLQSTAPALIYEEANLIKRAIRDLYDRDIDEIQVEGEEGYRAAKDFMRMLTPSHAKRVQLYNDEMIPLFHRFQVESQIDGIHSPVVQLRSGGYIVITPTEALVSIDVNSGRATKERNIEETALRTNLEAADEVARQLRLRDLAGLIVVDFIDMEEPRNNVAVERRVKEAMRADRARIQIGHISPFGLLELSRQRLRPSLIEATMQHCAHCGGSGWVRSIESTALHVLRGLEEEGIRQRSAELKLSVPVAVALYLLNQKRASLADIERRYRFSVLVDTDDSLVPPAFRLDRLRALETEGAALAPVSSDRVAGALPQGAPATIPVGTPDEEGEPADQALAEGAPREGAAASDRAPGQERRPDEQPQAGEGGRRRRRRRRRRRGRGGEEGQGPMQDASAPQPAYGEHAFAASHGGETVESFDEAAEGPGEEEAAGAFAPGAPPAEAGDGESGEPRRRRGRGRRGGRRRRRGGDRPMREEAPGHEGPAAGHGGSAGGGNESWGRPGGAEHEANDLGLPSSFGGAGSARSFAGEPAATVETQEADEHRARRDRRRRPEEAEEVFPVDPGFAESVTGPAESPHVAAHMEEPPRHAAKSPAERHTAPSPEPVREEVPRAEPAKESSTAAPAPEPSPPLPVISVGTSSGNDTEQQPKKRGWWQRLTD